MFVDASVIVAILAAEEDATDWSPKLESASGKITSALVVLESAMRLSTPLDLEPTAVGATLNAFLAESGIGIVSIDAADGREAIEAFSAHGKGRGHPAGLNLADCLAYACAKNRNMPLLYKGNDFTYADLG